MDLVIGIGNPLRGDDGIGPRVVAELGPVPSADAIGVAQLTPELALRLRTADRVLFVDAAVAGEAGTLVRRIRPARGHGLGHAVSPEALLDWTERVFGRAPDAWLLAVPGRLFDVAERLSPEGEKALPEAVEAVQAWLRSAAVESSEEDA
ncbi:MAG: hydrogenase maturation protease [Candidatus Bipolaricaulis sp.]|nr:hydrogenase maturation protease [Candidatus Bipolaricaulis sp.]